MQPGALLLAIHCGMSAEQQQDAWQLQLQQTGVSVPPMYSCQLGQAWAASIHVRIRVPYYSCQFMHTRSLSVLSCRLHKLGECQPASQMVVEDSCCSAHGRAGAGPNPQR